MHNKDDFKFLRDSSKIDWKLTTQVNIKALESNLLSKEQEYEAYIVLSDTYLSDEDNIDLVKASNYLKKGIAIANCLELDFDEDWKLVSRKEELWSLLKTFSDKCIENNDWNGAFEYCNEAIKYTDHPAAHLKIADCYIHKKNDTDSARKSLQYIADGAEYFRIVIKDFDVIEKQATSKLNSLKGSDDTEVVTTKSEILLISQHVRETNLPPTAKTSKILDKVLCSKCETAYNPGVKFCMNDGTKLYQDSFINEASVTPVVVDNEATSTAAPQITKIGVSNSIEIISEPAVQPTKGKKIKQAKGDNAGAWKANQIVVAVVALILLFVAGTCGYLYIAGETIGRNPDKIASMINTELKIKIPDVFCEIDKNWIATLKGTIKTPEDKDLIMSIVTAHKEIKNTKYKVQVQQTNHAVKETVDKLNQYRKPETDLNKKRANLGVKQLQEEKRQYIQRGKQYHEDGKFPEARHAYRNILKIDKNNRAALDGISDANLAERALLSR